MLAWASSRSGSGRPSPDAPRRSLRRPARRRRRSDRVRRAAPAASGRRREGRFRRSLRQRRRNCRRRGGRRRETGFAQRADDALEHGVAGRLAEDLVDRIEAPEIDRDDRQPFGRVGGGDAFAERLDEATAVQRARQRIVAGEIGEPRLLGAALGHVAKRQAGDAAAIVAVDRGGRDDIFDDAVAAAGRGDDGLAGLDLRARLTVRGRAPPPPRRARRAAAPPPSSRSRRRGQEGLRELAGENDAAVVVEHDDAIEVVGDRLGQHRPRFVALARRFDQQSAPQAQIVEHGDQRESADRQVDGGGRRGAASRRCSASSAAPSTPISNAGAAASSCVPAEAARRQGRTAPPAPERRAARHKAAGRASRGPA